MEITSKTYLLLYHIKVYGDNYQSEADIIREELKKVAYDRILSDNLSDRVDEQKRTIELYREEINRHKIKVAKENKNNAELLSEMYCLRQMLKERDDEIANHDKALRKNNESHREALNTTADKYISKIQDISYVYDRIIDELISETKI